MTCLDFSGTFFLIAIFTMLTILSSYYFYNSLRQGFFLCGGEITYARFKVYYFTKKVHNLDGAHWRHDFSSKFKNIYNRGKSLGVVHYDEDLGRKLFV